MKNLQSLITLAVALSGIAFATPVVEERAPSKNVTSISTTNPFTGFEFFVSPVYREEILNASSQLSHSGNTTLAKQALTVATKISTFLWISDTATISKVPSWLKEAQKIQKATRKKQVVQIQIYNLPERDCSAKASAGELSYADGGEAKYQAFILSIAAELKKFPDVRIVLALETDAIGNLVTNLAVPKCGDAAEAQKRSMAFAIANLQLPNVSLYVDGAHAGWLGYVTLSPLQDLSDPSFIDGLEQNLGPAADVITEIIAMAKAINPNAVVRGVATNISNYNGLGNNNQTGMDELVYVRNLQPLLAAKGFDAHFIVDQGRSGTQNYTREGTDWCNNKFAGFGPRPTTNTPDPLIDAVVWAKPGGECDGTSDTTAARFDEGCVSPNSLIPAPESGTWFQAYFVQLLTKANPPIPALY
ncbi:glycoside hydrolase family 6 protein [Serendipita vermifera MAFF 305830]|uniref:Glucanase n=1 Tax=Serendipita vermifera MAFF 305830 TaxID=933852 RepID=A0A0C2XHU7_SERVB|nr:glycoside hydrolase family 6 protein [Serendipita vermifera MAFF 305830]